MPVDPDILNLMRLMQGAKIPDLTDSSLPEFRRLMENSGLPRKTEKVKTVQDFNLEFHDRTVRARLYVPSDSGEGIILYFHGGGFVFGSIETHDDLCRMAANRSGARVLSVDYMLAPENRFPAALDDAYDSLLWVRDNADELGIDENRIAVAGDSAGGNISAALCLRARDSNMKLPALQVLFYPSVGRSESTASMQEYSENYYLTRKMMQYFGKSYLNSPSDITNPYFSVISHNDHSGLPEAIIVTAEYDPLRDEGEAYLAKLLKAGVRATGIRAKGMIHGFATFFPVSRSAENITRMVWSLAGDILSQINMQGL